MEVNNLKHSSVSEINISEMETLLSNEVKLYPSSVHYFQNDVFFMGKDSGKKYLYVIHKEKNGASGLSEGTTVVTENEFVLNRYPLTTVNRKAVQKLFDFTNPVTAGLKNSFGFGDRIGLANPGHIRALKGFQFFPVLAQQSIRELTRTNRTPDQVMDAAVWSVFQEGYKSGFGADADHLKTTDDIDRLITAGFKMFTFDPGEYVENRADILDQPELMQLLNSYPWTELNDSLQDALKRYLNSPAAVNGLDLKPDQKSVLSAYTKYGRSLAHVKKLYTHLKTKYAGYDYEIEMSVDETQSVTSVFEHYFISTELHRLGIKYVSLAPRFVGDFEKGIDYKGDLGLFENEYKKHMLIAKHFGDYKISLHSGSDKFSVYNVIGKYKNVPVHVKTAGTSYLEALKVTAIRQPDLLREILEFAKGLYETEKLSYHVSAEINKIRQAESYSDAELIELFQSIDARQVLHVTFGKVLTDKNSNGKFLFKDRIIECLMKYEDTHYDVLIKHFTNHLVPFK